MEVNEVEGIIVYYCFENLGIYIVFLMAIGCFGCDSIYVVMVIILFNNLSGMISLNGI